MRKATGKVVSLVLALALVITSFSATFASAATTTESGEVKSVANDTIYLANLNGLKGTDLADAKNDGQDRFNLSALIEDTVKVETYDHIVIDQADKIEVTSYSLSGDSVIKINKESDGKLTAILRADNSKGTAYVNVLYTAKTERDDGEEVTVRATQKFTIVVLDRATPILSSNSDAESSKFGKELDGLTALNKNPQATTSGYTEKTNPGNEAVTTGTGYVYLPLTSTNDSKYKAPVAGQASANGSAVVTYDKQSLLDATTKQSNGSVKANNDSTVNYAITVSGTNPFLKVGTGAEATPATVFTYGVADPSVGNTVRVAISSVEDVTPAGESSNDFYDVVKKVAESTARVENTVSGTIAKVTLGDGKKHYVGLGGLTITSKSKIYAQIKIGSGDTEAETIWWDVTGANLVNTAAGLDITDGRLASVKASGAITLTDVSVTGDVKAGDANDVTIYGGTVNGEVSGNNIKLYEGATVASVSAKGIVSVLNGKVSGTVEAVTVSVDPENDEATASVGSVKGGDLTVNGTVGAAAVSSYTAKAAEKTVTLQGSKASIGAIDDDYYGTTVDLIGFVGTVPAIKNGYYTGWTATGAMLTSNDVDDETKATVDGALKIRYIELNSGAVTFNSSVEVSEVSGGEADFIVNPGALRILEAVGTANTLKFINNADVALGKVAFYAVNDIADVDSFQRYGYDLSMKASGSYDVYTISGVDFAGLTLDATSVELVKGETAVVTASAYPNGTVLPEGAKIAFYFNGDDSYVKGYKINDTQAELVAVEYNAEFSVLNEGTLTAQVEDEYGIQLEEYGEATCDVKVVAQKAPTETYKSDTTGDVVVPSGNTYQFKITSLNGQAPSVVLGSAGVFELVGTAQEGNDYFFKFQAVGASGAATGVYVNGDAKVATMYVDGNTGYTCDTTTVNVPAGGTYQVKITAASMPTLAAGNSIYTVAFASQEGNDYFFKITATSAQAGDVVGFYINGGPRAFVATTV